MKSVETKSQKMVKCGHIWLALYKQAVGYEAKKNTINIYEEPIPSVHIAIEVPASSKKHEPD